MYHNHLYDENGKFKGKARVQEQAKVIVFPSGAKLEFSFLDNENEIKKNWQGAQLTGAYFEEFGNHSEFAFNYIRTRMRSKSKYRSFIRCTLNPEPNHFCLKYLTRFIDQKSGLAIKEFSGRNAYYIVYKGDTITSWDKEELLEKYPKKKPRVYTFIPSSLEDNKAMLLNNSEYKEDLESNDPANAALLLDGNWLYKPNPNGVWERSLLQGNIVDCLPLNCTLSRSWDKASSKPAKEGGDSKQLDPDFTASVGFGKHTDNVVYVFGDYKEDNEGMQRSRFRENTGLRDDYILQQAKHDTPDVKIILPRDLGQGGVFEYKESAKALQIEGFIVVQDPSVSNASKLKRFEPFVAACYNGNVKWVKSSFDPAVWDYMILELENFNPITKNNKYHDDIVDAFSSNFAYCMNTRSHAPPTLPDFDSPTMSSGLDGNIDDSLLFW